MIGRFRQSSPSRGAGLSMCRWFIRRVRAPKERRYGFGGMGRGFWRLLYATDSPISARPGFEIVKEHLLIPRAMSNLKETLTRISIANGEIHSLQRRHNGEWRELIYRADRGWRGGAPWLFPAVGRNFIPDQIKKMGKGSLFDGIGSWRHGA